MYYVEVMYVVVLSRGIARISEKGGPQVIAQAKIFYRKPHLLINPTFGVTWPTSVARARNCIKQELAL